MRRLQRVLIASAFGVVGAAASAATDGLDIKTGLWEVTYTTATEGSLVPKSMLDTLPPEQRAQVIAAANARAAKGPQTHVEKTCVTAEDLSKGAFQSEEDRESNCKYTVLTHTSSVQEETVVCTGEDARHGTFKVEALSRDRVKASFDGESGGGKLSAQMSGKWLGSSCAGADKD